MFKTVCTVCVFVLSSIAANANPNSLPGQNLICDMQIENGWHRQFRLEYRDGAFFTLLYTYQPGGRPRVGWGSPIPLNLESGTSIDPRDQLSFVMVGERDGIKGRVEFRNDKQLGIVSILDATDYKPSLLQFASGQCQWIKF